jgi:uncharacterized 2Fe-2S/4Fe-4S cluster protein (DUF4445 family)
METRKLEAEPGLSLFECAEELGLAVTNSCQKLGNCRECIVEVSEGADLLTPPTEHERHLRGSYRLACRARVSAASGTIAFRRLRHGDVSIVDAGHQIPAHRHAMPFDPAVTRDGGSVALDGVTIARSTGPLYGLALDLGTTTVVVRLVDLEGGRVKASRSFENPQCFAGSDVMARIAYASTDGEGRLRSTLAAYVNQAVKALPCDPECIYEIVAVGNPTMRDLFLGLDVQSLGQSPYRSLTEYELDAGRSTSTSVSVTARQIGLRAHAEARVCGLPLVGSHVGADAAACLLAIEAADEDRLVALMDIGTNTELLIGNRHKLLAASCPAGPAFEGGTIACGMPAFPGAIETVRFDAGAEPAYEVIGGGTPQGICGSGLLDTLSELLRTQRMNGLGRIGSERFFLDSRADIYLTEQDISRLAQAKGAHAAGWALVMKQYGAAFADIERLYMAGGFANHIDVEAALRIGLIPQLPGERVQQIGNAAIEGATLALLSVGLRRQLEQFVRRVEHIELETDDGFFDAFVDGCQFKPLREEDQSRST